ncbi:MAG: glycosyltransferase family 1 protein [Cyanobacteria bacterium SZAS LIN-3]|nr:glycosyltransferase family 1 protein [Cyanobacteria bacterium SZAS LIN-3]
MKIAIITDAWHPQVNGVVRTLTHLQTELNDLGHTVLVITPNMFHNFPCPGYREIRLAYGSKRRLRAMLDEFGADAYHISTEGPLGLQARRYCLKKKVPFTTAFHTRFPEYLRAKCKVPESISYAAMRWFHRQSKAVMVPTPSMLEQLQSKGFKNVRLWTRGVDTKLFRPQEKNFLELPRPIFVYVGRISVEKNIEAFLSCNLPGSKLVVGDGPQFSQMKRNFPDAHFVGNKTGTELAQYYAAADVFIFPSKTDTFGLVVLEALASGLPVAAYPVTGPKDIIDTLPVGVLSTNLEAAALAALAIQPAACREFALTKSWRACALQFVENLHPITITSPRPQERLLKS